MTHLLWWKIRPCRCDGKVLHLSISRFEELSEALEPVKLRINEIHRDKSACQSGASQAFVSLPSYLQRMVDRVVHYKYRGL